MRVESEKPCDAGGWFHQITGDIKPIPVQKTGKVYRTDEILAKYRTWTDEKNQILADELGVSLGSLGVQGVRWNGICWCFPMFDGNWRMIGIRERYANGKKLTMRGTHSGLFIPKFLQEKTLYLPEGPTDTAALYDMGLDAIGRPSCMGGGDLIKVYLKSRKKLRVVIVADNDKPKRRPDGTRWKPGMDGAIRLFKEILPFTLCCSIIKPPKYKDVREWYQNGCTRKDIENLVKNYTEIYP